MQLDTLRDDMARTEAHIADFKRELAEGNATRDALWAVEEPAYDAAQHAKGELLELKHQAAEALLDSKLGVKGAKKRRTDLMAKINAHYAAIRDWEELQPILQARYQDLPNGITGLALGLRNAEATLVALQRRLKGLETMAAVALQDCAVTQDFTYNERTQIQAVVDVFGWERSQAKGFVTDPENAQLAAALREELACETA